ncbi:MAG: anti-sigma factor [Gemmatimonadales bacterium]
MTERRHPLADLASDYVLGHLSDAERREFDAALATSDELAHEVAEYRELHAYLSGNDTVTPPTGLKQRLMDRVAVTPVPDISPLPKPANRWWGLAAAALLLVSLGLGGQVWRLQQLVAARDTVVAETARTLADRQATIDALLDPGVRLTTLVAPGERPPVVQVFHNRRGRTVLLHATELPTAPDGRVYQLWLMPREGNPIPSVTFNTDSAGRQLIASITIPAAEIAGFALSIEPAGGSTQPTTTPILVGME